MLRVGEALVRMRQWSDARPAEAPVQGDGAGPQRNGAGGLRSLAAKPTEVPVQGAYEERRLRVGEALVRMRQWSEARP